MLKVVLEERHQHGKPDLSRPIVVCDSCGEEITDCEMGLYVWDARLDSEFNDGKPVDLYTVHKRACDYALASRLGIEEGQLSSMELQTLPVFLGENMGLNSRKKWNHARDLSDSASAF